MPTCTILELEPLELDLLGVEVLLGGRRDRGLDINVDSEGGLLGALLFGLLCGPNAPGVGALGSLLTALGQVLSTLGEVELPGAAMAEEEDDEPEGEVEAEESPAARPPSKRGPKAKPGKRATGSDD